MAGRRNTPPPPLSEGESPRNCRRCELWEHATQAVTGEGGAHARIMLVGEQPGDAEDRQGHPFVGPAGVLLHALLKEADIEPAEVFITNAVKHFRWEPRGKRRLHKKPDLRHIDACHVWLDAEIISLGPRVIVTLGATALRAVTGSSASIAGMRGQATTHASGARILASYHPSAILRADERGATDLRHALLHDLRQARKLAASIIA